MFFHCLTKQGLFGDTHVQVVHAFPPQMQLCVSTLHSTPVAPFKYADYYGTSYDEGENRYAKNPSIGRHAQSVSCVPFYC